MRREQKRIGEVTPGEDFVFAWAALGILATLFAFVSWLCHG